MTTDRPHPGCVPRPMRGWCRSRERPSRRGYSRACGFMRAKVECGERDDLKAVVAAILGARAQPPPLSAPSILRKSLLEALKALPAISACPMRGSRSRHISPSRMFGEVRGESQLPVHAHGKIGSRRRHVQFRRRPPPLSSPRTHPAEGAGAPTDSEFARLRPRLQVARTGELKLLWGDMAALWRKKSARCLRGNTVRMP